MDISSWFCHRWYIWRCYSFVNHLPATMKSCSTSQFAWLSIPNSAPLWPSTAAPRTICNSSIDYISLWARPPIKRGCGGLTKVLSAVCEYTLCDNALHWAVYCSSVLRVQAWNVTHALRSARKVQTWHWPVLRSRDRKMPHNFTCWSRSRMIRYRLSNFALYSAKD
jgi:hypothetical protein